jgi:hypothetical protein
MTGGGWCVCVCVCGRGGDGGGGSDNCQSPRSYFWKLFFFSPNILGLFPRAPASTKKKERTQKYGEKKPLKVRKALSFFLK